MFVNSIYIWYNKNMDKNMFNINNNELSYGRGYVYSLQYHLVWCTKYRKKVLKDGIDTECKEMLYDLAEECGDVSDSSYEALEKRWKDENAKRSEKVEKGEVVYGLKEYTFQLYLQYEMSTLKEKYCNDDTREGMELTEDEILEYYNSREWIFGDSEENADLETARIAVERELREKKYDDIITQRETDSQVDGNMADVNRFTLKNIE